MISQDVILVRYGEIALKDRWTRQSWERLLISNIAFDLSNAGLKYRINKGGGRIFVHTYDPCACEIISGIFGVISASSAKTIKPDLSEISVFASKLASDIKPKTFAIRPRRGGGRISSEEIGRVVGDAVRKTTNAEVALDHPELQIFVEAREDNVYIFTDVRKGVGGLPLGSQGKMVALLSGGIDSPVAAWSMMRRGCPVVLLHFDSRPYANALSQSLKTAEVLARWTSGRKIDFITVPIRKGIEKIAAHYPRATCVLCRRLMYRIAACIMESQKAYGIVTGYSLGQVASQTAENILAEQADIGIPIYHPLIALDKSEIIDLARKIGTYLETEKTKSCSAVPLKPMTKAKRSDIISWEDELGLKDMAGALASEMNLIKI